MLFVLVQSLVFISDFLQLVKSVKPVWREVAFRNPFLLGLKPVEHVVVFQSVLGRAAMMGFHKHHHLLILLLPSLVLGHAFKFLIAKIQIIIETAKIKAQNC